MSKTITNPEVSSESIRASVTFPKEIYNALELIAQEKRVSLAWVVRDAAERYISERWPLLNQMNVQS